MPLYYGQSYKLRGLTEVHLRFCKVGVRFLRATRLGRAGKNLPLPDWVPMWDNRDSRCSCRLTPMIYYFLLPMEHPQLVPIVVLIYSHRFLSSHK